MRALLDWSAEREQAEIAATAEALSRHGAASAPESLVV
jgi:hypothetical protein